MYQAPMKFTLNVISVRFRNITNKNRYHIKYYKKILKLSISRFTKLDIVMICAEYTTTIINNTVMRISTFFLNVDMFEIHV